ncbi:single-stranded DNA-binding protein [Arthrobacter sp. 1088]|uniref:single-stranded DNA-binding protein n=1 Tax=Arthrobacter sp. 1088 TaxID=2817768 RepID=UPI00286A05E1|nr:single-stranded DNA-binding protein [Arthrobacter sp. 1088]
MKSAWEEEERFRLSGRRQDDLEEFGRIANPSGIINVPAPDPHEFAAMNYPRIAPDLPPWPIGTIWDPYADDPGTATQYPTDATHDTTPRNETRVPAEDTSSTRGKGTSMAGETTITVIGNLTNDPELRFTPSGSAVANFTIASTPRTFDRQSNEFKDGETLFLRASAWREMAENVAESLTKGTRVIASGRLKSRSYETKEGEKRIVIELEIDEVGPSLRYANVSRGFKKSEGVPAGNSSDEARV